MGNTSTKEHRQPPSPSYVHHAGPSSDRYPGVPSGIPGSPTDRHNMPMYSSRSGRSRPDLSFLGLGSSASGTQGADAGTPEGRRETKVEREARRAEREKIAREKERMESMRDESVDGGYLVTQGVYTGTEDFNKVIVRQLMIERRLAPFFKGLSDHSDSWKDHQLVAAVIGLPIPAADDIPEIGEPPRPTKLTVHTRGSGQNIASLTVPIASRSRSHSYASDTSSVMSPSHPAFSLPSPTSPATPPPSSPSPFRPRSKTIASLTTSSKANPQADADMAPVEIRLLEDPYVDGRPIEAYLYREVVECPICFLYYPPYLNKTRCCDQPICSECFVQIKRPDPHPPEHSEPASPTAAASQPRHEDGALVSEPSACPFCVQPEFGVTFEPPPFRRGLAYANNSYAHPLASVSSAMSSSSSLAGSSPGNGSLLLPNPQGPRRRTISISANASTVITTDRIRPDWAQKLANARAHAARRAAAATALHTAAYLMNSGNSGEGRIFAGFGRRGGLMRRTMGGDSPGSASGTGTPRGSDERGGLSSLSALAAMAERHSVANAGRSEVGVSFSDGHSGILGRPGGDLSARRRTRMMDLEDMMLIEAIRLSLAEEEERKKREEKEEKKNAKKKEKEMKKAAKKGHSFGGGSDSAPSITATSGRTGSLYGSRNVSSSTFGDAAPADSKGKSVDRTSLGEPSTAPSSLRNFTSSEPTSPVQLPPSPLANMAFSTQAQSDPDVVSRSHLHPPAQNASQPFHPSHLRQMSSTSSSASSSIDSPVGSLRNSHNTFDGSPNTSGLSLTYGSTAYDHGDSFRSCTPPGGGAGTEPMFNFRSLAAVIGDEEKQAEATHIEQASRTHERVLEHPRGESSNSVPHYSQDDGYTMDDSTVTLKPYTPRHDMTDTKHTTSESIKHAGSVEVVLATLPATEGRAHG